MDKNVIKIGYISGPHGIKGEVKVFSYVESPDRFKELDAILLCKGEEETEYAIEGVKISGPTPILKLSQVESRNDAERLKGYEVFMYEEDLPELPPGQYYIKDLIGFDVVTEEGQRLGTLKDIQVDRAQSLYVVERDGDKDLFIPGVPGFILEKDVDEKKIVVSLPEGLLEL